MASRNSHEVPRDQRGRLHRQNLDGSVLIYALSGSYFLLSGASVASTGMGRLLAEGLVRDEPLYWTTRESLEGQEIDQVFRDRIDDPRPRFEGMIFEIVYQADQVSPIPHNPIDQTDRGGRNFHRLSAYDEPHPFSLRRARGIESFRNQSQGISPTHDGSYHERAIRGSVRHEQPPPFDDLEPLQSTLSSCESLPPYSRGDNPPPYTSNSHSQNEMNAVVSARLRSDNNDQGRGGQGLTLSQCFW